MAHTTTGPRADKVEPDARIRAAWNRAFAFETDEADHRELMTRRPACNDWTDLHELGTHNDHSCDHH
jgi:hypothetical protein